MHCRQAIIGLLEDATGLIGLSGYANATVASINVIAEKSAVILTEIMSKEGGMKHVQRIDESATMSLTPSPWVFIAMSDTRMQIQSSSP